MDVKLKKGETFEKMLRRFSKKARKLGSLNNSIRKGGGNFAGYIGQMYVAKYLGIKEVDTYNHDLEYKDMTLEVKSKQRTVDPDLSYDASIAKTSMHQNPDVYIFTSVKIPKNTDDVESISICGWMSKKEYFDQATFYKKGDIDPSNGWKVSLDCYNLPYSKLYSMEKLLSYNKFKIEEHIDWS